MGERGLGTSGGRLAASRRNSGGWDSRAAVKELKWPPCQRPANDRRGPAGNRASLSPDCGKRPVPADSPTRVCCGCRGRSVPFPKFTQSKLSSKLENGDDDDDNNQSSSFGPYFCSGSNYSH